MKKILLPLLALGGLISAVSCQMDERTSGALTGEVDFSITAGIPSGITTYSPQQDGEAFSHMGGANNVDTASYDLRFILEVYDGKTLAYRDVQSVDENFTTATVNFNARLLAKSYTFVLWADFVNQGSLENLYYNADNLKEISYTETVKKDVKTLSTDIADAYSANKVIDLSTSSKSESITLTRPFGKIRLLATDENIENNNNTEVPVSVKLDFQDAELPANFNALSGETSGELTVTTMNTKAVLENAQSIDGDTRYEDAYLLGSIYIMASNPQGAYPVNVTVYSDDAASKQIGYREITALPVSANKLTTVIGNFYSNEGNLDVNVDDMFDDEDVTTLPDAVSAGTVEELKTLLADPEIDAITISDMTINETITVNRKVLLTGNATITTSGTVPVFTLSAEGVEIDGLTFKQDANTNQHIITITAGNCEIRNCTFEGKYQDGNNEVTRAICPNAGVAVTVEGNTFKNIRQPGYFQGNGTVIRNNYVEGTRGFVICSDSEMTIENNSFSGNVVDIAIIDNAGATYSNTWDDVRTLSGKNNGAYVENQVTKVSAIGNGNVTALTTALQSVHATAIELLAGKFELSSGITIPTGKTVNGSSRDEVILSTQQDGNAVNLYGTLKNVSVIYDTDRTPGSAWTTNPAGVTLFAGSCLEGCSVEKFRNGLYANNVDGITIKDNIIRDNRTGLQLANAVGATVTGNTFRDNETMGVLLQYLSVNNGQTPTFTKNVFDGNWYSDFENRWTTEYTVDLSDNTFTEGSVVLKVQSSTGEPGSNVTFTKPASQVANIVTALASNIIGDKFFPISDDSGNVYADLQSAIDEASEGATLTLKAGLYSGNYVLAENKSLIIKGANAGRNPELDARETETIFTGTISTGINGNPLFYKDQTLTIDGILFTGDGIKIGHQNYNFVGNIVVKYCIFTPSESQNNSYFVSVSNNAEESKRGSVTLEYNKIGNREVAFNSYYLVRLWAVKNVNIVNNTFEVNPEFSGLQLLNLSVLSASTEASITIQNNNFLNGPAGIAITPWKVGDGNWFDNFYEGKISVSYNYFENVAPTSLSNPMRNQVPIFISPEYNNDDEEQGRVENHGQFYNPDNSQIIIEGNVAEGSRDNIIVTTSTK